MPELSFKIQNLTFEYPQPKKLVFEKINFDLKDNFYYIAGDSGTGKTTLLELLTGWLKPTKGKIIIKNNLTHKTIDLSVPKTMNELRKSFGIIFQDLKLDDDKTVEENLYKYVLYRQKHVSAKIKKEAKKYLISLGFSDIKHLLARELKQLSGGEKQRIAIIRALLAKPKILFCDEITSGVGASDTVNIVKLLENYAIKEDAMILFATHDNALVRKYPKTSILLSSKTHKASPFIYHDGWVQLK